MKGIYVLLISIKSNISPKIGALGSIKLTKGIYAYVGSAQNNLQKRIERHLRTHKRFHWHIDYLLNSNNVEVKDVLTKISSKKEECRTAQKLLKTGRPIIGFGCSDCRCKSHLFKIDKINIEGFKDETKNYL
jgi:Uri superfamily endonuclease